MRDPTKQFATTSLAPKDLQQLSSLSCYGEIVGNMIVCHGIKVIRGERKRLIIETRMVDSVEREDGMIVPGPLTRGALLDKAKKLGWKIGPLDPKNPQASAGVITSGIWCPACAEKLGIKGE